eukprot:3937363-Rhodomonas_salina.2
MACSEVHRGAPSQHDDSAGDFVHARDGHAAHGVQRADRDRAFQQRVQQLLVNADSSSLETVRRIDCAGGCTQVLLVFLSVLDLSLAIGRVRGTQAPPSPVPFTLNAPPQLL